MFNGVGSLFFRDDALDTSNSLDTTRTEPLPLRRYDYSLALGGPMVKDKLFFFGSAERISEDRQLDFEFPDTGNAVVNQLLRTQEAPYRRPDRAAETRVSQVRRALRQASVVAAGELHQRQRQEFPAALVGQQPALGAQRHRQRAGCSLAFADTALLGDQGNPYVVTLRGAIRGEKSDTRPSQSDFAGATLFNPFDAARCTTRDLPDFGNLPIVSFGNIEHPQYLDQEYT